MVVDTETNKPKVSWRQGLSYNTVDRVDTNYILSYNINERFSTDDEALPVLKKIVEQVKRDNKRKFESNVKQVVGDYSDKEVHSWDQQVKEAEKWTADNTASVPLLSEIATIRGMQMSVLVEKVFLKANAYSTAYGQVLGEYQRVLDVIESIDFNDPLTWDNIDLLG